jgi:hypothetical protein
MGIAETSFEEAKQEFTSFLAQNGLDQPILWVFTEDVYSVKSDIYSKDFWLKLPLPAENEEFARRHFEFGKEQGFGICLTAFASCDDGLCCSFIVPTDDLDAQYLQMGPEHMKYSFISRDMPVAQVVRSKVIWIILGTLRFCFQPGNFFDLTSRAELKSYAVEKKVQE